MSAAPVAVVAQEKPIELNDPCKATHLNVLTDSDFILLTDKDGKNLGALKFEKEIVIRLRKVKP